MISLEAIKAEVNRQVEASDKVILGVWANLVKAHNEFCGCDYCETLKLYVKEKLRLHRCRRQERYGYYGPRYRSLIELEDDGIYLAHKVKELRKQKDAIKRQYMKELNPSATYREEKEERITYYDIVEGKVVAYDPISGYIVHR